jgi:hypothetical protein
MIPKFVLMLRCIVSRNNRVFLIRLSQCIVTIISSEGEMRVSLKSREALNPSVITWLMEFVV